MQIPVNQCPLDLFQRLGRRRLDGLQMETTVKIHVYDSNTGYFQPLFGHLGTTGPKTPKVGGTFAGLTDVARIKSNGNPFTDMRGSQAGIKRKPVELTPELLTITLFTIASVTSQPEKINPSGNYQI